MRSMLNGRFRFTSPVCVGLAVLVMGIAGGCGWTPRDEFQYNRSLVLKARPGDGSELSYRWKPTEEMLARRVGAELAAMPRP